MRRRGCGVGRIGANAGDDAKRPSSQVDGRAMKKTLTATHFVLGNDKPTWGTTATMADPTGNIDKYRAVITGRTASKGSSVCRGGVENLLSRLYEIRLG